MRKTTEQILVRAMLKPELLACEHKGKKCGKATIKAEVIQAEIQRRINNTPANQPYAAWGRYSLFWP